jgi:hypothetical protein
MKLKKLASIYIFLIIKGLSVFAQTDSISLTTIVTKTDKLSSDHPFEKVYLHFDKPYYAVNDTIWFKAYLTIGPRHQPSPLSNIIYVDLINSGDSVVKSMKLQAPGGLAQGDIFLSPFFYKKGSYHVRAYTNWMRNFGADYFFNKTITIADVANTMPAPEIMLVSSTKNTSQYSSVKVTFRDGKGTLYINKKVSWEIQNNDESTNIKGKGFTDKNGVLTIIFPPKQYDLADADNIVTIVDADDRKTFTNKISVKKLLAKADVQFFPEGGELISGIRSKVAFKAINAAGVGVDVTGTVVDNTGADVADFTSQHAGMGIFPLLPDGDKSYKAVITFPGGRKNEYELPKVSSDGITVSLNNNDPDNLSIKLASNESYFKQYQNRGYYIVAQSGGTIFYTAFAALKSRVYTATVAKDKFPTGILQVTLFAVDGEALSERIAFIQHNDALSLSLKTDVPSYKAFGHVVVTVSAKNGVVPVAGSFSAAVVDDATVPFDDDAETTILSSLLLTSDLKGYIEKPAYYFNGPDDKKMADLDVLMLTQGYRRLSYHDILSDKYPPVTFHAENGIEVSGTLRNSTGVPVYNGNVNLKVPDRSFSMNTGTDADGHFSFNDVTFYDSSQVILSARNNPSSGNLVVTSDLQTVEPVAKNYDDPFEINNIDSTLSAYVNNVQKQAANSHVLKEVVIKSTKTEMLVHDTYTALVGLSPQPDQILRAEALKDCSSDFEGCVLGRIYGLWHAEEKYYFKKVYDFGNKKPIKFFVNGLGVDETYLTTLNPADILGIEVFEKDGIARTMQFYDCNGIISITTKTHSFTPGSAKADLSFLEGPGNEQIVTPKGYFKYRSFYSPKYINEQSKAKQFADLRSTIYWNPTILTDKAGNATFDFFNAAGTGTYKAVIEGMDADGHIGRYVLRYKVN